MLGLLDNIQPVKSPSTNPAKYVSFIYLLREAEPASKMRYFSNQNQIPEKSHEISPSHSFMLYHFCLFLF
jgi:hypothetical protein